MISNPQETFSNNKLDKSESSRYGLSPFGNQELSIKPRYLKICGQILTNYSSPIFNYLSLKDLSKIRGVNKMFYGIVSEYYEKRLKIEIQDITDFQTLNKEKTSEFMKNIDSQIPISYKNWLNFDLNNVTNKIQSLSRNTITQLRSIKKLGKLSENIFAPFCIIFGYNKSTNYKVKSDGWKKTAMKILNDSNFFLKASRLDLENFNDNDILEAFIILNTPEFELSNLKKISPVLSKLIEWCQSVVSYHILIHPYTYRNDKSQIQLGGEVYEFSQIMDNMINKFYKFKRFLFKLGLIKIPLGDYVFNLQHTRDIQNNEIDLGLFLDEDIISNIFSYLPINQSCRFMNVNKMFTKGYVNSLDIICYYILKEIFFFKYQAYEKLKNKIPIIYENNIFSKYFLMLDDILNSDLRAEDEGINYVPFLSKEQLNDIKNLKIETEIVISITKVLCILLQQKTERKLTPRGELKNLYLKKIKSLSINGSLLKLMRNINKLELNKKQINVLSEEMLKYYSIEKLESIKKINRGLYQLLIWELYIFEYLKEYNPFIFLSIGLIQNGNNLEQEEIEMIKYYIDMLNYLKYNLKAKYHFQKLTFGNMSKCPSYNFIPMMEELNNSLKNQGINTELIFDTLNQDHAKISNLYFESRNLIPLAAKPALYDRIMIEIISATLNNNNNQILETNTIGNGSKNDLGTIKEENSIINNNNLLNSNFKEKKNPILSSIKNSNVQLNNLDNKYNNYMINNNNHYNSLFEVIPNEVIIKSLLFFFDINSLPNFSLVNKKCNECVKTHIFIRLFFLNQEKKLIEDDKNEIITSIESKREKFYEEYEMDPPDKEHACNLMSQITSDDILEIKQLYRKYNKTNEKIIAPLVILLDGKPDLRFKLNGLREISYFKPAQKLIFSKDFIHKIQNLELETITLNKFNKVEKLMQDQEFSNERMRYFSPCLNHLICWEMGVVEFHRVIRNYSLSYYDYSILDNDEIIFCQQMDNIILIYYKLLRYANKYCKVYEKNATELMKSMNIQTEETEGDNEIENENNNEINYVDENKMDNDNNEINNDNEINDNNNNEINNNEDENDEMNDNEEFDNTNE